MTYAPPAAPVFSLPPEPTPELRLARAKLEEAILTDALVKTADSALEVSEATAEYLIARDEHEATAPSRVQAEVERLTGKPKSKPKRSDPDVVTNVLITMVVVVFGALLGNWLGVRIFQ